MNYSLVSSYHWPLVSLSVAIAIVTAYTLLELASQVQLTQGKHPFPWLLGGAIALGTGIWSMHFIGMLAFCLPVPVHYHWSGVFLSLLPAIVASGLALYFLSLPPEQKYSWWGGTLCWGLGITAMHYSGMMAMDLPAEMVYHRTMVGVSILLALVIAGIGLRVAFWFQGQSSELTFWQWR